MLNTPPRTSRRSLPTVASLGLNGPYAQQDLETLGWNTPEALEQLWTLAAAGDPNLALNQLIRLHQALDAAGQEALLAAVAASAEFRIKLIGILGASTALGDHLVAHPQLWELLKESVPSAATMCREMLQAVSAAPAVVQLAEGGVQVNSATADLTMPGTYRAGICDREAEARLKTAYRTLLLRIAAADVAGTYRFGNIPQLPFTVVSGALTDLADAALTAALAVAVARTYPEKDGEIPAVDTRLAVLAMGKCGARELNYISDVDVIFVAEPASSKATRLAGEFIKIGCTCFFEVDAALRPEGKRGALVRTLESHLAYYQRWAHTWEFQAQLKHRPLTGDLALGEAYHAALFPLVWQACERESFVDDTQAMRTRVIDNVPEDLRKRELKLGPGGLRDVEFAVQLLQMVHGRSDESLRVTTTVVALQALIDGGYIGREDGNSLIGFYEFLRLLEHRLQLMRVKRTHLLPPDDDDATWRWLARTCGVVGEGSLSSAEVLKNQVRQAAVRIRNLHTQLFYRPLLHSVVGLSTDTLKLTPEAAKRQLKALRYKFPERAYEHLVALASGARRSAKIQAIILPTLMGWLADTADPDAGLLAYRRLSEESRERQWFLRLLRDEGVVGQRLMHILGNSPYATELLLASPETIKLLGDGASGPKLLDTDSETIAGALVAAALRHADPARAIAAARSLRKAELARIAAADMLGLLPVKDVCLALSQVWCAVLEAGLKAEMAAASEQLATIAVIGMGRLGGMELGYGSDADVMFVCEPLPGVDDAEAVRWAIGICDRMRKLLAKPSGDPPLEVDLGLRPEGRSGAIVRTLASYQQYYERWGEVWEMQALLRAAPIAGDEQLGQKFISMINPMRYPEHGASAEAVKEVRRIKARVDNERLPRGADRNTHTKLGRGGLADVEWTVQLLCLLHAHEEPALHTPSTLTCLDVLEQAQLLAADKVAKLRAAWLLATTARNALVLVKGKRTDQLPGPGPQLAQVAGAAGWKPAQAADFLEHYLKVTRKARAVVDEVFWGETKMGFEP